MGMHIFRCHLASQISFGEVCQCQLLLIVEWSTCFSHVFPFPCAVLIGEKCHLLVFIGVSVTINKEEPLFICLLAICALPTRTLWVAYLHPMPIFSIEIFIGLPLKIYVCSCILQVLIPGYTLQTCHTHFYFSLLKAVCGLFCYITVFHCYIVISKSLTSSVMSSFGLR